MTGRVAPEPEAAHGQPKKMIKVAWFGPHLAQLSLPSIHRTRFISVIVKNHQVKYVFPSEGWQFLRYSIGKFFSVSGIEMRIDWSVIHFFINWFKFHGNFFVLLSAIYRFQIGDYRFWKRANWDDTKLWIFLMKSLQINLLIRVCPKKHPVLSLRRAFFATMQSPLFLRGIASLKNRLRQKTPRNDRYWVFSDIH